MGSRAAARLETLGFIDVRDYIPGKLDWLAYGLPIERPEHAAKTVIDSLDRNIPVAFVTETVGEIHLRLKDSNKPSLLPVINDRMILLGVVDKPLQSMAPATPVTEAMDPGPSTIRPYTPIDTAMERLTRQNRDAVLVTCPDGKLLGIFRRQFQSTQDRLPATGIWD